MMMFQYILSLIVVCISVRATDFNHTMADINIGSVNINGHVVVKGELLLLNCLSLKSLDVVFIQETHSDSQ